MDQALCVISNSIQLMGGVRLCNNQTDKTKKKRIFHVPAAAVLAFVSSCACLLQEHQHLQGVVVAASSLSLSPLEVSPSLSTATRTTWTRCRLPVTTLWSGYLLSSFSSSSSSTSSSPSPLPLWTAKLKQQQHRRRRHQQPKHPFLPSPLVALFLRGGSQQEQSQQYSTATTNTKRQRKETKKKKKTKTAKRSMSSCQSTRKMNENNHPTEQVANAASMDNNTEKEEEEDPWSKIGGGAINEKDRWVGQPLSLPTNKRKSAKRGEKYDDHENSNDHRVDSVTTTTTGFDPMNHKAHLWHALEGLDRYPNYLSRWNDQDMTKLKDALQDQLQKVQAQREQILQRRNAIQRLLPSQEDENDNDEKDDISGEISFRELRSAPTNWEFVKTKMLHPTVSRAIFRSHVFQQLERHGQRQPSSPTSIEQVLSGQTQIDLDAGLLESVLDEALDGVYTFPLLRPEFCAALRNYINAIVRKGQEEDPSLHVGLRPVDLDTIGLSWINDLLFHLVLRPIARHLYQPSECGGGDLDWRQGYVAGYSAVPQQDKPRQFLVTHTDDSEVTLNVGLGLPNFEGGALEFRGLRGTKVEGQLVDSIQPVEGRALIHAGRHFHNVTPVTKGDRYALIIWARSWNGVRQQTCPCCWLNRRRDGTCICGSRWN